MKKILVTGSSGYLASSLLPLLRRERHRLCLFDLVPPADENGSEMIVEGHINDRAAVEKALGDFTPEWIINLAGVLRPDLALGSQPYYDTNVRGVATLLDAVRQVNQTCRVLLVGTAAEYGPVPAEDNPVNENHSLRPFNAYGRSKALQTKTAQRYVQDFDMDIVVARAFNTTGPREPATLFCSAMARQLALLKRSGGTGEILVGNLDSVRDFLDVRDVASALLTILDQGEPGFLYNVGSGKPVSMCEVLNMLCDIAGMDVEIKTDPERFKLDDIPILYADNTRLKALGWYPQYELRESLSTLFDEWMARVGNSDFFIPVVPGLSECGGTTPP
jgi:GDP-4-dehydro-6-deoxy-D-mannose reductase